MDKNILGLGFLVLATYATFKSKSEVPTSSNPKKLIFPKKFNTPKSIIAAALKKNKHHNNDFKSNPDYSAKPKAGVLAVDETEFADLEAWFETEARNVEKFVMKYNGTSIIGNGIKVATKFKGKRIAVYKEVFPNIWSQVEQEAALKELIKRAIKMFPHLKNSFYYEHGNMD